MASLFELVGFDTKSLTGSSSSSSSIRKGNPNGLDGTPGFNLSELENPQERSHIKELDDHFTKHVLNHLQQIGTSPSLGQTKAIFPFKRLLKVSEYHISMGYYWVQGDSLSQKNIFFPDRVWTDFSQHFGTTYSITEMGSTGGQLYNREIIVNRQTISAMVSGDTTNGGNGHLLPRKIVVPKKRLESSSPTTTTTTIASSLPLVNYGGGNNTKRRTNGNDSDNDNNDDYERGRKRTKFMTSLSSQPGSGNISSSSFAPSTLPKPTPFTSHILKPATGLEGFM